MNKNEIDIVKKHAKGYCFRSSLPKHHICYIAEGDCDCTLHRLAKELKVKY